MADNFAVITMTLPAEVATDGTFEATYPAGTNADSYDQGNAAAVILILDDSDRYAGPDQVEVAYGATVTVTNRSDVLWRAGQTAMLQLPKVSVFADEAEAVAKNSAVTAAGMGIAALGAQTPDQAGIDAIVAKINELVAAYQAAPPPA